MTSRARLLLIGGLGVSACGYSSSASLKDTYIDPTFNARSVKSVLVTLHVEALDISSSTRFRMSMGGNIVSNMSLKLKERSPNVSVGGVGDADVRVQGIIEYVSQVDGVDGVEDEEGRKTPTTKGKTSVRVRLIMIDNRAGRQVWEGTGEGTASACDLCLFSANRKRPPPVATAANPAFDKLISSMPLLGTPAAQRAEVIDSVP